MPSEYTQETVARLYRSLYFIRRFEERVAAIYPSDAIKSPVHLSIGQEFISVAVCDVLRADDVVSGTYRGHAAYLAKGGDPKAMMAEMYGKATGCAAGRGGSMHLIDANANVMGASAVVGTTVPIAAGYALAMKRRKTDRVVAAFFGDGASEEGCFYETLNFAALHKLPILFVCENNFYAIHEPQSKRWATDRFCERVATFGIETRRITSGDLFELRDAVAEMVETLRRGEGPALIECHAYRWREHVGPNEDFDQGYRPRAEAERWMEMDQVPRLAALLPEAERAAIEAEAEAAIDATVAFAEQSPFPEPEELYRHVFA